jgi:hypothetical protein
MNASRAHDSAAMSAIADLITARARKERDSEARLAVRWVERIGWRFRLEDFEEVLAGWVRLTDCDRAELRAFRDRLIEERAA